MSLSPTMLPCKKRKTTQMDSFSEAGALPMEASPSDGPLLPKPEMEQEEGEISPTMKSLGDTQRVEPLQEVKEDAEEMRLFISVDEREGGKKHRRKGVKRQWEGKSAEEDEGEGGGRKLACDLKLDETLDRTLEDGAKQHNLTAVNVRNILHEVITNEHVVAMMKAAISETEDAPVFEPKMTRSKLKEVVEKGVVIPTWNISPIKKANELKPPQFVDIPLEDDDSSDEEYQPEEDEEDETAEESLLESDVESSTSSPRGPKRSRSRQSEMMETDEEGVAPLEAEKGPSPPAPRHVRAEVIPMGPPPPPPKPKQNKDSAFMEKLHAVDQELASSPVCMDTYQVCGPSQPLEDSLIALRTRSKRPLRDVPLGQLEAELRAPDITPDMYDPNTADDEEWKQWLSGLMNDDVENEDEADDDDDPEYNFLEDLDEPDTEDFRNDRAVRITKKEVNELMEELFETFQDEIGFPNLEDDGLEDEEGTAEARPNFNTPQVLRFEEPLANLLNEQHRTVKEQLEQLRVKKSTIKLPQEMERSKLRNEKAAQTLVLDAGQRKRLQQQMQQHVQLLTQVHLLSSCNPSLSAEASTSRLFLNELESFAQSSLALSQPSSPAFQTSFQPFNLKESLQLIKDFHAQVKVEWSPRKAVKKNMTDFACLPKQVAWILATQRVFLYPELLPTCSFKAKTPRDKIVFTKGEDNLLALGLKHFEGTDFPKPLISKYLLTTKTAHQLTGRIKNRNMNRVPDNIIRYYKTMKQLPVLPCLCEEIQPGDWKPPATQEEQRLPFWLKASLPSIQEAIEQQQRARATSQGPDEDAKAGSELADPANPECPLRMPEGLQLILRPLSSRFCRRIWRWQRPATAKPFLVQPCLTPAGTGSFLKMSAKQPVAAAAPGKLAAHVSPLPQPTSLVQPLSAVPHLNLPTSALGHGPPFALRGVLSARPPGPHPCLAPAVAPNVVSSLPVAFQPKMILPALPTSRVRKVPVPRGSQKKKTPKVAPLLKAAPVLHPAPVIFTVPAGTVKVLGLANGCNVLQPLSATARAVSVPQSIPITTLLVNPAPFSCPLNQPVAASSPSAFPLVVASNSGPPSASGLAKDAETSTPPVSKMAPGGDAPDPGKASPKTGPGEPGCPWSSELPSGVQTEPPVQGYLEGGEGRAAEVLGPAPFSPVAELGDLIKVESDASKETPSPETSPVPPNPSPEGSLMKGELVLGFGQGLEVKPASGLRKALKEGQSQPGCEEEQQEEEEEEQEAPNPTGPQAAEGGSHASPANAVGSSVADPGSSSGKGEEAGNRPEGTASAGQEGGGEKDGLEEEEEEDFDDYIQDEEDEMSSASEESVLSVPELQETMEKLTWLASERRLSQEGDSEEENSQEENSEPEEEEEEEEEGEGEPLESQQKEDEMANEVVGPGDGPAASLASTCTPPTVEASSSPPGENPKAATKSRASQRARAKRGRGRTSKDASKLLLLYDDDILERDPLREQKDFAFAQAYLNRVREALHLVPGKYEEFLRNIYEFENNLQKQTAVDLYARLRILLQDWPQLLTDFAAFLLPEQALECGLFEEQQAFEKSRTFLRRLEICFAENPSHHQKIIKVLQNCADCVPQEIMELKNQMWQLLKGHDHLQDEFSVFFDHLRPSASRLGDFEEISWTEEKEYEFDGFEEVSLPDMEEEEEPPKIHAASKNKRRKELGSQNAEKESEWPEGQKDWCSSCHENSGDPRMKRSKRRSCAHCSSKVGDPKGSRNKEPGECLADGRAQREPSTWPEGKETPEGHAERRDDGEAVPGGRIRGTASRKGSDSIGGGGGGGVRPEGKFLSSREPPPEGLPPPAGKTTAAASPPPAPLCPPNGADPARNPPTAPPPPSKGAAPTKSHRPKSSLCPAEGKREVGPGPRSGGEAPPAPNRNSLENKATPDPHSPPSLLGTFMASRPSLGESGGQSPSGTTKPKGREMLPAPSKGLPPKTLGASLQAAHPVGKAAEGGDTRLPKEEEGSAPAVAGADRSGPVAGEDLQPRTIEATVCAKNIKLSSTGEKVVLWTREADRVILTSCQERGADPQTFSAISEQLGNKTPEEVSHRFRELMTLFHTACDVSSDDDEDGMSASHADQLSDKDPALSEDEREETGF